MIKTIHVVSAIILREDQILMMPQPGDEGLYWFIPGGVVESGEVLFEALKREVLEETGLVLCGNAKLAYVTQVDVPDEGYQTLAFVFETSEYEGSLVSNDPDALIHGIEFVPRNEAVECLVYTLWESMRVPLQAYIKGETPAGAVWQYRQRSIYEFELMARIP